LDASYYAVQFDTSRDLVSNNNPEGVTGLYAIFNSLINSSDLKDTRKRDEFKNSRLHEAYSTTVVCVYLIFFTSKINQNHNGQVFSRVKAYLLIQEFKQQCFKEITKVLEELMPEDGIEWRFEKK